MFSFLRRTSLYILVIPVLFTFLGAASNQLVLLANHDTFPVMVNDRKLADMTEPHERRPVTDIHFVTPLPAYAADDTVYLDDTHCAMTSHTHLNALADIFDMKDAIYSIGDFSLMLGDWLWAFAPFLFAFDVIRKLKAQA
jgi:hypothetical protein